MRKYINESDLEIELCQLERGQLIGRIMDLEEEIASIRFKEALKKIKERND